MEIQLEQILGLWRYQHDGVIIDLYIRRFDENINRGLSFFTVYSPANLNAKINYEWQGIPVIVNHQEDIPDIEIHNINHTAADSIYQNIKIWQFEEHQMTLEFGDGSRLMFQKLGV